MKTMKTSWFHRPGWWVSFLYRDSQDLLSCTLDQDLRQEKRISQILWNSWLIGGWCFFWFHPFSWGHLFGFLVGGLLSSLIPRLMLQIRFERFSRSLEAPLAPFLDLFVLALQSGLNLEQSLRYLSKNPDHLLHHKLQKALHLLSMGGTLPDVLDQLVRTLPISSYPSVFKSLSQAYQLGIPLISTLEAQSHIIRTKRRQKAEELSRTASVKITIPLVFFIFPALLIIYLGPGVLQLVGG